MSLCRSGCSVGTLQRCLPRTRLGVSMVPMAVLALAMMTGAIQRHTQPATPDHSERDAISPSVYRTLDQEPVRAIGAIDARTIVVLVAGREIPVRLRGIDAATSGSGADARHEGIARYVLHNWVAGEMVRCAGLERARAGVIAFVERASDRHDIGGELIRQGYLRLDDGDRSHARHAVWADAQEHAAAYGKGLWGESRPRIDPGWFDADAGTRSAPVHVEIGTGSDRGDADATGLVPASPDDAPAPNEPERVRTVIYVTPSGSKYHLLSCRFARSAAPIDPKDVRGTYDPCSVCRPPALADLIGPRD